MNKKIVFGLIGIGLIGLSFFVPIVEEHTYFSIVNSFIISINLILILASLLLLYQDKYQYLWIIGLCIGIIYFYSARTEIGPFLSRLYMRGQITGQINQIRTNVGNSIIKLLGIMILIIISIVYKRKEIKNIFK